MVIKNWGFSIRSNFVSTLVVFLLTKLSKKCFFNTQWLIFSIVIVQVWRQLGYGSVGRRSGGVERLRKRKKELMGMDKVWWLWGWAEVEGDIGGINGDDKIKIKRKKDRIIHFPFINGIISLTYFCQFCMKEICYFNFNVLLSS